MMGIRRADIYFKLWTQFKELMENYKKVILQMIIIDIKMKKFPESKKTLEFSLTGPQASAIIRTV
ncbi:MAG: hypothetical protein K2O03_01240, partial [Lachnospiraceae bacterium]|nr:hypothetical protein [Lachnospiraceae bacterium]